MTAIFRARVAALSLALLTLALYLPVRGYDFVAFDDDVYIRDNPVIRQGFSLRGAVWAFRSVGYAGNWHPLTWISHMLDVQFFGLWAGGHHLVSAFFHAANAALLLLLLQAMTGSIRPAVIAAALFALHPLRVESVAWISERKDVLCAFFGLLTLLAYLAHARRPGAARRTAVAGLFLLGLISKPMLVSLPLLMLLLDWWPLGRFAGRGSSRRLLGEKIPLLALAAAGGALTIAAQRQAGAMGLMSAGHDALRLANAASAYASYLGQTFWPAGLVFFYELPAAAPLRQAGAGLALVAAVSGAALLLRRRAPWLGVGWGWYLVGLLPVIGLLQVGSQAMADRYTYLPAIGVAMALAWGLAAIARSGGRGIAIAAAAAAVAALIALALITRVQLASWSSTETLYARALAAAPGSSRLEANAAYDLGVELWRRGRLADAKGRYEAALRLRPAYPDAHNNLGALLMEEGRVEEAVRHFEAGLASGSGAVPSTVKLRNNLGLACVRLGRFREAAEQFRSSLALDPNGIPAHFNLGLILEDRGETEEALAHYREAVRLDPDNPQAAAILGRALLRRGAGAAARGELARAARLRPQDAAGFYFVGLALELLGDREEAAAAYAEALRRDAACTPARQALARLEASRPHSP